MHTYESRLIDKACEIFTHRQRRFSAVGQIVSIAKRQVHVDKKLSEADTWC